MMKFCAISMENPHDILKEIIGAATTELKNNFKKELNK